MVYKPPFSVIFMAQGELFSKPPLSIHAFPCQPPPPPWQPWQQWPEQPRATDFGGTRATSGWWCNNHLENWWSESQWVSDDIPFLEMENKIHVWNHQPDLFWRNLDIWPIKSEDCQEKRMINLVSRTKHEDIYQQKWGLPTEMWTFPNITGIQNNINEDAISTKCGLNML